MANKRVTGKRLRMTLDFEVEVEELTDESLREYYRQFPDFEETVGNRELWANISRQIRLQHALLGDAEALRRYLTHVVVTEVDASLDSKLAAAFGVGGCARRRGSSGHCSRGRVRRTRGSTGR